MHIVKAVGESRSTPTVKAEWETEMQYTAIDLPPPTTSPTSASTATIPQQWGLEELGSLDISPPNGTWPSGYTKEKSALLVPCEWFYTTAILPS